MAGDCEWRMERQRREQVTPVGERFTSSWVRFVCECGKATHWYRDEHRAESARDRHAVNGQQRLL